MPQGAGLGGEQVAKGQLGQLEVWVVTHQALSQRQGLAGAALGREP